ncbi:galectin-12 isoform X6 [Mustela putorius furo]|uniref:Galectin n=1 Tax=Mustela putorius furo TaxID=9669 RepID=A0A8U0R8Y1_MUSPF|nr:galectin-12 isoform X6 [Mustela putorius furo]
MSGQRDNQKGLGSKVSCATLGRSQKLPTPWAPHLPNAPVSQSGCEVKQGMGQVRAPHEARRIQCTLGAAELSVCLSFQVSVNGQHFLHYRYRLPLSRVDTLGIFGDILVEAIGFLNISPFLLKSPSLEVPCSRALPRGLWPGQVIVLRGLVLPEPKDLNWTEEVGVGRHRIRPHEKSVLSPSIPVAQLHTEPAGRGRSRARDAPGFLRRQNSGLDLALGVQEADLSPLPLLSTAILRGAAPLPGGRAEAGAQRAGPGHHQPPAADPGATAGAPGQWQCPALLRPLLRSEPGTPPGKGRARPGTP